MKHDKRRDSGALAGCTCIHWEVKMAAPRYVTQVGRAVDR